ncbi:MAG TPA: hypothetical protein VIH59_22195 [Candidatus Tectomicrobia bacterium]
MQAKLVLNQQRTSRNGTVAKHASNAVQAGSRLYTDSAGSYRAVQGYVHEFVNHTQKE